MTSSSRGEAGADGRSQHEGVAESEEQSISRLVDALTAAHPHLPAAQVRACVLDAHARFTGAKIRTYVPVLVARRAAAALRCSSPATEAAAGRGESAPPLLVAGPPTPVAL